MDSSLHGLEVSSESVDCCGIVKLRGDVDLNSAPLVGSHIEVLTRNSAKHLLIDCEGLSFIDSSGIHVLVGAHQVVHGNLGLVGLREPVQRLFEIVGLSEEFKFFNSIREGREYLHNGRKPRFSAGA